MVGGPTGDERALPIERREVVPVDSAGRLRRRRHLVHRPPEEAEPDDERDDGEDGHRGGRRRAATHQAAALRAAPHVWRWGLLDPARVFLTMFTYIHGDN